MNIYGSSIKGKRDTNQDRYVILHPNENTAFLAVADGMGGTVGGGIAADLVIEVTKNIITDSVNNSGKELELKFILSRIYDESQKRIKQKIIETPQFDGMGTTLSCVLVANNNYAWANIGDSRIYLYSKNKLQQITKDHSMIEEYNKFHEVRYTGDMVNYYGHLLTRSLNGGDHEPDIFPSELPHIELANGEGILICSDGLLNKMRNLEKEIFMEKLQQLDNTKDFVESLIDNAYENGSNDNITCVTYWNGIV